jgi:hypothetical protein
VQFPLGEASKYSRKISRRLPKNRFYGQLEKLASAAESVGDLVGFSEAD